MPRNLNIIGLITPPHKRKSQIFRCQGHNPQCLGKFIKTRGPKQMKCLKCIYAK